MEHTSESHLQQSVELAQQAAAQMKKAAKLAEQAAQLWQKALTLANQEDLSQPPPAVQMSVAAPKRKKKQHIRPETVRLIEDAAFRQANPATGVAELVVSTQRENTWEDGDNWWKPLQQTSPSDV